MKKQWMMFGRQFFIFASQSELCNVLNWLSISKATSRLNISDCYTYAIFLIANLLKTHFLSDDGLKKFILTLNPLLQYTVRSKLPHLILT